VNTESVQCISIDTQGYAANEINFFEKPYFSPYGVLPPQVFMCAWVWPRLANPHPPGTRP